MFIKILLSYLIGYLVIEIEGYYIERYINICRNQGIAIWHLKRQEDIKLIFRARIQDFRELIKIAKKTKCKLKIKGLDCANCAAGLERAIQKIDEIENANISFMTERMEIEYESSEEEIIKKIQKVIKREEPDVSIDKI